MGKEFSHGHCPGHSFFLATALQSIGFRPQTQKLELPYKTVLCRGLQLNALFVLYVSTFFFGSSWNDEFLRIFW